MKVVVTGRLQECSCGGMNRVLTFHFTESTVEVAACYRCDWLVPKNPKELR